MGNYIIPENPVYEEEIRKLENSDPASAETIFNPLISTVINNVTSVKKGLDQIATSLLTYDLIIKTQVEFEEMYNSPSWLNAVSVAFVGDGGTLKFTRSDGMGLMIPQTVKQLQGFNSAIIEVTNFVYDESTNIAGLWYMTLPTTDDYSIRDLSVNCTNMESNDSYESDNSYAFHSCTELTNCTGIGIGTRRGYGYGFCSCTQLTSCTGTGVGIRSSYGFYDCTQLTNCIGIGISIGDSSGSGFASCTQLTNCTGDIDGDEYGMGFYDCTQLTNCTGTITGIGIINIGYGFYDCHYLNGCKPGNTTSTEAFLGGTTTMVDTLTVG